MTEGSIFFICVIVTIILTFIIFVQSKVEENDFNNTEETNKDDSFDKTSAVSDNAVKETTIITKQPISKNLNTNSNNSKESDTNITKINSKKNEIDTTVKKQIEQEIIMDLNKKTEEYNKDEDIFQKNNIPNTVVQKKQEYVVVETEHPNKSINNEIKNPDFSKLEKTEFVKNQTIIYHSFYGKGVFICFDEEMISIKFDSEDEIKRFVFPSAFSSVLTLEKSEEILKLESAHKDSYYHTEDILEQVYFNSVKSQVEKTLSFHKNNLTDKKTEFNYYGTDRNRNLISEYSHLESLVRLWTSIYNNPFFSRIVYMDGDKSNSLYIGKNEIPGYVISWKDKRSEIYYRYQLYTSRLSKYKLHLLRNFKISLAKYISHDDVFNLQHNNNSAKNRLLTTLKEQRNTKKTHDIIETIQTNQYNIISADRKKNMLVFGCAGSGKTMILLHRLSYLMFNYDISPSDVFIISPTSLLNLEMDELSKALNVNDAYKFTNTTFNKFILFKYYLDNKIQFNKNSYDTIIRNFDLDKEPVGIYDDDLLDSVFSKLTLIMDSESNERKSFINYQKKLLEKKYSLVLNKLDSLVEKSREYKNILSKISIDDFIGCMENLDGKSTKIAENRLYVINCIYEKHKHLLAKQSLAVSNSHPDFVFKNIYNFFNITNNFSPEHFNELFLQIDLYMEYINAKSDLENFINGKNIRYLESIFRYLLNDIRNTKEIKYKGVVSLLDSKSYSLNDDLTLNELIKKDKDCYYEYEIFIMTFLCSLILKTTIKETKYVLIDEVQDYSIQELLLYKLFFSNSVFNYYGDVNQCLNNRGFAEIEKSLIVDQDNIFYINENYRNANEITRFINKEFKMNMTPLGLSGTVKIIKANDILHVLEVNNSDRLAIIVDNNNIMSYLFDCHFYNVHNQFNKIATDNDCVRRDKINIITADKAKGLEFEQVVVVKNDMSNSKLYVSYSRALNNLFVVTDIYK